MSQPHDADRYRPYGAGINRSTTNTSSANKIMPYDIQDNSRRSFSTDIQSKLSIILSVCNENSVNTTSKQKAA